MAATHGSPASGGSRLSDYDYIRTLTRSRIAWEYLRRHPGYRRDWRNAGPRRPQPALLSDGTVLIKARRRFRRAEAWGLHGFRRPR